MATFGFNKTALRAEATLDVFRPIFEDCIISFKADVVWPPRICDFTPLDYYLWSAVKDKCYVDKKNICEVIGEIQLCFKIVPIV